MASPHNDASKTQSPQSYLYTCLAANHLGTVAATIVSALISYGRLSAREIGQKSKLSQKQTRSALVSLIQLNCVQYWSEKPGIKDATVYYSFHSRGLDLLLHAGDIISNIKISHGDDYAEAVQNILENGSMSVDAYMASFDDAEAKHAKMAVLVKLYNEGWLRRLQKCEFHPSEDMWQRMFDETLKKMPRSATTSEIKRTTEAKETTKIKYLDLYASGSETKDVFVVEGGIYKLRPEVTLAVSLSRYEKSLRSRSLADLAHSRMGLLTSKVYETCCALIEQNSPDLHHRLLDISGLITVPEDAQVLLRSIEHTLVDNRKTVFSVRDVVQHLPENIDLRHSILTQNFLRPNKRPASDLTADLPSKKVKLEEGGPDVQVFPEPLPDGPFDPDLPPSGPEYSSDLRPEPLVAEHLRLLSSSHMPFLVEIGPGSFTIPFLQVAESVKKHHFDALVKATLGANALRVLKCIQQMRLVDEKAIANAVLLKDKTVKNEVYRLVTNNMLEIQEVPRSADRAASKTFYLFRHREDQAYDYLARSLLFSMGSSLSNIEEFRAEHKILLEKCEREDVRGHEEELLLESELTTLRDLRVREVKNMGRFNRLKWLQFVFGVL